MARPKGIPHTEEYKSRVSQRMKGKKPKNFNMFWANRYIPPKGSIPWNKNLKFEWRGREYNFDLSEIKNLVKEGQSMRRLAKKFGCSVGAIYNFVKKHNIQLIANKDRYSTMEQREFFRKKRLNQRFNQKETKIEIKCEEILRQLRIPYEKQKNVMDLTLVDFFIKPNICIYCDGEYWHSLPKTIERDNRINEILKFAGYKVIRFSETQINKSIDTVKDRLKEVN